MKNPRWWCGCRKGKLVSPLCPVVLAFTVLASCSLFGDDYTDLARLPRNDAAGVAAATVAGLATPDLDLDGNVNGFAEWEAFVRAWVQAYQATKK